MQVEVSGENDVIPRIHRSGNQRRISNRHISAFWDWQPTFTELAGVPILTEAGIDAISMVPALYPFKNQTHKFIQK